MYIQQIECTARVHRARAQESQRVTGRHPRANEGAEVATDLAPALCLML